MLQVSGLTTCHPRFYEVYVGNTFHKSFENDVKSDRFVQSGKTSTVYVLTKSRMTSYVKYRAGCRHTSCIVEAKNIVILGLPEYENNSKSLLKLIFLWTLKLSKIISQHF